MKLVMTLLVRDEQDIVRENIEFHLSRGVDEIILMDNRSCDATADIAADYVRSGVLHYIFQPEDDYSQGRWVTRMARMACEQLRADWVINNDADEFWWPWDGSLKDAFRQLGPETLAASVERSNFLPRPIGSTPFWQRMDVRHAVSLNTLGKPLSGKVAHRALADVVVAQGNHAALRGDQPLEAAAAPISILHFPIRSREQFTNKIVNGGAAYDRNVHLDQGMGATWRKLYRRYVDGRLDDDLSQEMLSEQAIAEGLLAGRLVRDERLKQALGALCLAPAPAPADRR